MYAILVAVDQTGGIGKDGEIPWDHPEDRRWFRQITKVCPEGMRNAVIMGRKTWESIGKPLPDRLNIVLTSSMHGLGAEIICTKSFDNAVQIANRDPTVHSVFVIGGSSVYKAAMIHPAFSRAIVSRIPGDYKCDVHFDTILLDNRYGISTRRHFMVPDFVTVLDDKSSMVDIPYLELVGDIMKNGSQRSNRTNVDTISVFGRMLKVPLQWCDRDSIPLLSTKFVPIKAVWVELIWFLSGSSNIDFLKENGVTIWDGNTSREFLDSKGLHRYRVGELGPGYGWQWRHFGAEYVAEMDRPHMGWKPSGGVDQISRLITGIKADPYSRRHLLTAWNPKDVPMTALPPCHYACEFYVENGELQSMLTMRSCDVALGLPFNIASYAILTHLIAYFTGLRASWLTVSMGDTHIYLNHVAPLQDQLLREPRGQPFLKWNRDLISIDDLRVDDLSVIGYCPHPKIAMQMAV